MNKSDDLQNIERHFFGQMSGDELAAFEEQLNSDSELSNLYDNFRYALKEVQNYGREDLKSKLSYIHHEFYSDSRILSSNVQNVLKIAAVILLLAMLSIPVLYNKAFNSSSTEQLFTEYFEPYTDMTCTRGDDLDESGVLRESAMYYYERRNFEKAIVNFEELFAVTGSNDKAMMFYYGISCLGDENYPKAIQILKKLAADKDHALYEQVRWYLALAYLKVENLERCRSLLNDIIENEESYTENARILLDEINCL